MLATREYVVGFEQLRHELIVLFSLGDVPTGAVKGFVASLDESGTNGHPMTPDFLARSSELLADHGGVLHHGMIVGITHIGGHSFCS